MSSAVLCLDSPSQSNGIIFAAGLGSGEVKFFDDRSGDNSLTVAHNKGQIVGCRFVEDDFPHFVSAGTDKSVRSWDMRNPGEPRRSFDVDHVPTKIDVVSKFVCVPCETGRARLINLSNLSIVPLGSLPFSYSVSSSAFLSDDGKDVMLASWDGTAAFGRLH
jgi:WD40 repeat protein